MKTSIEDLGASTTKELLDLTTYIQGVKASTKYEIEQLWTSAEETGDATSELIRALQTSVEDFKTSPTDSKTHTSKGIDGLKSKVEHLMSGRHAESPPFPFAKGDESIVEACESEQNIGKSALKQAVKQEKAGEGIVQKVSSAYQPPGQVFSKEPFKLLVDMPVIESVKEPALPGLQKWPTKESSMELSKVPTVLDQDPESAGWECVEREVEVKPQTFNKENKKYQVYVQESGKHQAGEKKEKEATE
jgi:hypothetical protein